MKRLSFSPFVRHDRLVDLTACVGTSAGGDLDTQIASAFETLVANLEAAGGHVKDIVAIQSSHVQLSPTALKLVLREFSNRGVRPTWTAVGVRPFDDPSCLVQIRGQAVVGAEQRELAVDHAPLEYAACIRAAGYIFVSGQTGEDANGVLPEDQLAQVTNAFERVDRAIRSAGGNGFNDTTHFTSWSAGEYSVMIPQCRQIARTSARLNEKQTCWTFLGAESLPKGLVMIHADHIAINSQQGIRCSPGAVGNRNSSLFKYEQAIVFGHNTWLSGQGGWEIDDLEAPYPNDREAQIAQIFLNIERVLTDSGGILSDLQAVNIYLVGAITLAAQVRLHEMLDKSGGSAKVIGSVTQVSALAFPEMLAEIQVYARH